MPTINRINENIAKFCDGKKVRYLNVNDKLADADGKLFDGMMNSDKLHPAVKGYQVWADGLKPIFNELLGPPAATDHARPPPATPAPRGKPTRLANRRLLRFQHHHAVPIRRRVAMILRDVHGEKIFHRIFGRHVMEQVECFLPLPLEERF